jgi:hypothetical protein
MEQNIQQKASKNNQLGSKRNNQKIFNLIIGLALANLCIPGGEYGYTVLFGLIFSFVSLIFFTQFICSSSPIKHKIITLLLLSPFIFRIIIFFVVPSDDLRRIFLL